MNMRNRMIGAIIGTVIGLGAALLLHSTHGYDVGPTMVVVGLPIALILARAMGGPLSQEAMTRGDRALARRVKLAGLVIGVATAVYLGYLMGEMLNGFGLAAALLVAVGPRWGIIVDERMGKAYERSASIAFAVFSLGSAYLGFYQAARAPGLVGVGSFVQLTWLSWAVLVGVWAFSYFVGGE